MLVRSRGFAVVELLVALVVVAIVVAVVFTVVNSVSHDPSTEACRLEAVNFDQAVHRYYERQRPHAWPEPEGQNTVVAVALMLRPGGELEGRTTAEALAHLDGSQKLLVDDSKGWTYDFDAHTTNANRCG
jgi:prepilin-type N-terminal cleavage/methylation domain-containing protein